MAATALFPTKGSMKPLRKVSIKLNAGRLNDAEWFSDWDETHSLQVFQPWQTLRATNAKNKKNQLNYHISEFSSLKTLHVRNRHRHHRQNEKTITPCTTNTRYLRLFYQEHTNRHENFFGGCCFNEWECTVMYPAFRLPYGCPAFRLQCILPHCMPMNLEVSFQEKSLLQSCIPP